MKPKDVRDIAKSGVSSPAPAQETKPVNALHARKGVPGCRANSDGDLREDVPCR